MTTEFPVAYTLPARWLLRRAPSLVGAIERGRLPVVFRRMALAMACVRLASIALWVCMLLAALWLGHALFGVCGLVIAPAAMAALLASPLLTAWNRISGMADVPDSHYDQMIKARHDQACLLPVWLGALSCSSSLWMTQATWLLCTEQGKALLRSRALSMKTQSTPRSTTPSTTPRF